ncbi:MAG: polynucleotide kinase [Rhizobacter sp.]|nr:polynucleotide kinase [Bacteriovorax sp.]
MKDKAIIVDLDGTLCDVDHRVHHVQKHPKNWHAFNSAMDQDKSYFWCLELIAAMRTRGYKVFFVTGRDEHFREMTSAWLKKHHVEYEELYMRAKGDFREDSDVKEEIYNRSIENVAEVLFVVDDRKSVVERWRKMGLTCLQCAPGDF